MAKKTPTPSDYSQALEAIKNRVRAAQYDALKAVNRQLITLYWDIGHIIVERQQAKSWGKSVVERLGEANTERELERAIIARIEVGERIWHHSQRTQRLIDGGVEISFVT